MNKLQKPKVVVLSLPEHLDRFITKIASEKKIRKTTLIKNILSEWIDKQLWIARKKK
ncbi:MAG: hypothetical protein RMJ67_07755 [Elusimicrobiota bacterium]|nr:hypothetical protein [Endomicrobiia bacterium]MDW8166387.1 hypothetical protein [Elusimicrobiota bacterium]